MDSVEKAKYLISHNVFMTIATADASGKPWVSPVGFAFDQNYNFYWVSSKEAVHSRNIAGRPEIAISILGKLPDGSFDGVYVDAKAMELTDAEDIEGGIKLFHDQRPQPPKFATKSVADVTGESAWRMYRASPVAVYKRAETDLDGRTVTIREQIQL